MNGYHETPGAYLSHKTLQQQRQQLHQLNQEQFQELQQHHQQMQLRLQTQQQHPNQQGSNSALVDEDACSPSSSYNSPVGSIANQSLASTSSENQLDATASAASAAAATSGSGASTSSATSRPSSVATSAAGLLPHRKRRYKVQMPEAEEPFLCHVCGDRALGYNFDAVTCESCKAFFRRNALKKKEHKCNFSGECDVSVNTRKFCSACRLKKCFSVGMKKDWILNESELQQRREKTRCNRETRSGSTPTPTPLTPTLLPTAPPPPPPPPQPQQQQQHQQQQQQQQQTLQQLPIFKLKHNAGCCGGGRDGSAVCSTVDYSSGGRSFCFNPPSAPVGAPHPPPPPPPPPRSLFTSNGPSSAASATSSGAAFGAQAAPSSGDGCGRPSVLAFLREEEAEPAVPRWTGGRPLSLASAAILNVIRGALDEVMNNVDRKDSADIRSAANAPVKLEAPFAITLSFVQRFVLFVKQLPEYSLIEQPDMVNLIKGGVFHFILMRGVSIFNPAENTFSFESNQLGGLHTLSLACLSQSLSVYPNGRQLLSRYQRFMMEYHSVSHGDQLALTLLQLIEFYNPARPNIINMHRVDRVQQGYILLLWRYIQHRFPEHCARRIYFDLMNRLSELEDLASQFSQLCHIVGFRYEELNPLLVEVFELHQQHQQQQAPPTQQQQQRLDEDEDEEADLNRRGVEFGNPAALKHEPATPRSSF